MFEKNWYERKDRTERSDMFGKIGYGRKDWIYMIEKFGYDRKDYDPNNKLDFINLHVWNNK